MAKPPRKPIIQQQEAAEAKRKAAREKAAREKIPGDLEAASSSKAKKTISFGKIKLEESKLAEAFATPYKPSKPFTPAPSKWESTTPPRFETIEPDNPIFEVLREQAFENAAAKFSTLEDDIPVLMMPVRIETRFTYSTPKSLRIRIFPDQIGIDGFKPALSTAEFEVAQKYLDKIEKPNLSAADKKSLWYELTSTLEPYRAAWVVQKVMSGEYDLQDSDDTNVETARAPLLPDRWFVYGYVDGRRVFDEMSSHIDRSIAFSPDFSAGDNKTSELNIDPDVKWMFDFEEAKDVGMALEFTLPDTAQDGIDELYVMGIRTKPRTSNKTYTSTGQAKTLESLLEAQYYDWGAGFVPQGTATNNTEDVESSWSAFYPDLDQIYHREFGENAIRTLANPSLSDDAALIPTGNLIAQNQDEQNDSRLINALGLESGSALTKYEHHQGGELSAMQAMNTLLWPVTLGTVLDQMLEGPEERYLDDADIDWVRKWFRENVVGGAPLPAIRAGETPYGILPVQWFSTFAIGQEYAIGYSPPRREINLEIALRRLLSYWQAATSNVIRLAESPTDNEIGYSEPGERLIGMLEQGPNPGNFKLQSVSENSESEKTVYSINRDSVATEAGALVEITFTLNSGSSQVNFYPFIEPALSFPDSFSSTQTQSLFIRQKRDEIASINQNVRYGLWSSTSGYISGKIVADLVHDQRSECVDRMVEVYDSLLTLVSDHYDQNFAFRALGAPSDMYRGVLDHESPDPILSFLFYDEKDLEIVPTWHPECLIEYEAEEGKISVFEYLEYLISYAQNFKTGATLRQKPVFPDGNEPLLYQLLKDAIDQVDQDESSSIFNKLDNMVKLKAKSPTIISSHVDPVQNFSASQASTLLKDIQAITKLESGQTVKKAHAPLARTLRTKSKMDIERMSSALKKEAKTRKKDPSYPADDVKALTAELDKLSGTKAVPWTDFEFLSLGVSRTAELQQMIDAMELIKTLSPKQIELLMTQSLGVTSWRLDAWITSLSYKRIREMRKTNAKPEGIQIGAFGWVENLKPNPAKSSKAHEVRTQGFIHTPSINHAKTAAILRSGWNNYGTDEATSTLATDLSSDRMREAKWLFDGIRQGQDLGDLLGYRFERALRYEARAPEWIFPIRQAVLVALGQDEDYSQPVVDGLELHEILQDVDLLDDLKIESYTVLKNLLGDDDASKFDFSDIQPAFDVLIASVDTLTDAAIADSVHALVQGNYVQSGSALSAISDGEVPPPEMRILETAPLALTQTHRIGVFKPAMPKQNLWLAPNLKQTPRAYADPDIEALVNAILGEPEEIVFEYALKNEDGEINSEHSVSWADILESDYSSGALHLLHLLPEDKLTRETPLGRWLAAYISVTQKPEKNEAIVFSQDQSARDLFARLDSWRKVIVKARPIELRDLMADGMDTLIHKQDIDGLEKRSKKVRDLFLKTADHLLSTLPKPVDGEDYPIGSEDPKELRKLFLDLAKLGFNDAIFISTSNKSDKKEVYDSLGLLPRNYVKNLNLLSQCKWMKKPMITYG